MAPLANTNSGARLAFYVIVAIFAVLEQRVRLRSWRNPSGSRQDGGSLSVVVVCIAAGIGGGFLLASHLQSAAIPGRWPVFIVGLILMCAGITLRQWAIVLLGRFVTVDVRVHHDQPVIARGPYRWVRHPSYSGLILTLAGIGLALGNWAALAMLIVLPTAGIVVRIRSEEHAACRHRGAVPALRRHAFTTDPRGVVTTLARAPSGCRPRKGERRDSNPRPIAPVAERVTVAEAGALHLERLAIKGRKRTTSRPTSR